MFKAVVVDANLTQVAPTGPFFVSDALVGKPFATEEKDLKLSFPPMKPGRISWTASLP